MNTKTFKNESKTINHLLIQLWSKVDRRRKKQLFSLLLLMFASSLAEVLTLASVLPFLAVIANPQGLLGHPFIRFLTNRLGINGIQELLLIITIFFGLSAILSASIRLLELRLSSRFSAAVGSDLASNAYSRTLWQPYSFHVSQNSSVLISTILNSVAETVALIISPFLILCSSSLISIALTIALLIIDWRITIASGLIIALVYFICINNAKIQLQKSGSQKVKLSEKVLQALNEGFGAVRDVILDGTQNFYVNLFQASDRKNRDLVGEIRYLIGFPKLIIEPLGIVLIASIGFFLVLNGGITKALPIIGALVIGAQKLLPIAQKIYECYGYLKAGKPSLVRLLDLLSLPEPEYAQLANIEPIKLNSEISFKDVSFRYKDQLPNVINKVNFRIRKGDRIGIIGKTGGGKTTTLNILMGLLRPTNGQVFIDGNDLHDLCKPEMIHCWMASVAHVPQDIYLTDSTIAENIALGIAKDDIDFFKLKTAARKAQLEGLIDDLPDGYSTFVGEQGVRLSGGQRQRIAIARAFYKDAQILIFDEATSALDLETEAALMQSIDSISFDITIIMIAHRIQSLSGCNHILRIEDGSIKADNIL